MMTAPAGGGGGAGGQGRSAGDTAWAATAAANQHGASGTACAAAASVTESASTAVQACIGLSAVLATPAKLVPLSGRRLSRQADPEVASEWAVVGGRGKTLLPLPRTSPIGLPSAILAPEHRCYDSWTPLPPPHIAEPLRPPSAPPRPQDASLSPALLPRSPPALTPSVPPPPLSLLSASLPPAGGDITPDVPLDVDATADAGGLAEGAADAAESAGEAAAAEAEAAAECAAEAAVDCDAGAGGNDDATDVVASVGFDASHAIPSERHPQEVQVSSVTRAVTLPPKARKVEEENDVHEQLAKWLAAADIQLPPSQFPAPLDEHVPLQPTIKSGVPAFWHGEVISVSPRSAGDGEGTVGPDQKSPPVVGRSVEPKGETSVSALECVADSGPSAVTIPRLKHEVEADACGALSRSGVLGPGLKAQAADASNVQAPSVFAFLRNHFADVDADNDRQVCEAEFVDFIVARTHHQHELGAGDGSGIPADCEKLLRESGRRCYRQALVREEGIRVEDWVHFGLLLTSAPSHLAHHLVNRRLRRELRRNPFLLKKILHVFEATDVRGAGVLRASDVQELVLNGADFVRTAGLQADDEVTYYDFLTYSLGYRRTEVTLNWYDVSRGYAGWVPAAVLGGHQLAGIWHTGVVAFGREYWYGGKVLSSEPGKTPFPPGPVRSTKVGTTLATREELEDFLRFEMAPRYTREQYDVLRRNCNHFSDEVVAYLVPGASLPDEARRQPEVVLNAPLFEGLRPYLNNWLGGFDGQQCDSAEIDDLMTEWRARLWPGDLVLYVPQQARAPGDLGGGGGPQLNDAIRLVQVNKVDAWKGVCDIAYFEPGTPWVERSARTVGAPGVDVQLLRLGSCVHSGSFWNWTLQRIEEVRLAALRPQITNGRGLVGTTGAGLTHMVRAGMKTVSKELQSHMRRKATTFATCASGHVMRAVHPDQATTTAWGLVQGPRRCAICEQPLPRAETHLECPTCAFYFCGPCDRRGLFQGYYSLGSIDAPTAKSLLQEPRWIRYKAQRYMAAAGATTAAERQIGFAPAASRARLGLELWQQKVAARLYTDLSTEPPGKVELVELFRRFSKGPTGVAGGFEDLGCDEFVDLLTELLAIHAEVVTL